MDEMKGRHIIQQLQQKWTARILAAYGLYILSGSITLTAILVSAFHISWFFLPLFFILAAAFVLRFLYKKITVADVSAFLNTVLPELQESTGLLVKPYESLGFLEKLQVSRIEKAVTENIGQPRSIDKKLRSSCLLLASVLLGLLGFSLFPVNIVNSKNNIALAKPAEIKLPQVKELSIAITPPAYTGKHMRQQDKFNIVAEEDARLTWNITTTMAVSEVQLLFNDKSTLSLRPANKEHTKWVTDKEVKEPGFYQVKIAGSPSELYRIEMTRDLFPVITVQSPKPNTLIEPGRDRRTQLTVLLSDDYGVKNTSITATIASGSGEAVRFKKQQLVFTDFTSGGKQYLLQKQIDLSALGMKPGDELYFYISATDTRDQEKRSDIYIIRIEDTAQLMSMAGLASGVDVKPEFFRSQRQIIIETELLLSQKDTMSLEHFNNKSNDLGIDQKLLRLRYGKFLGEETDEEIGKGHDDHDATSDASDFGNAQKMVDAVTHKHDNAEDAGFFDAETKKQLKATLDEMWKAELQLRSLKPKEALPFEYKALKLLKELQQQTRVYVAKTGSKTTPLKPEKRLTGELDKIIQPVQQQNFTQKNDETLIQRKALGVLDLIRNKENVTPANKEVLEQAGIQIGNKAAEDPAVFLSAFEAYRRILNNQYKPGDIILAGSALQRMIKTASRLPYQQGAAPDMKLSEHYFMNLNRAND